MNRNPIFSASLMHWNNSVTCQTTASAGSQVGNCSLAATATGLFTQPHRACLGAKKRQTSACFKVIKSLHVCYEVPPSSSSAALQCLFSLQEQMEYVTVNPNATQVSGSCGTVQSELNLTFSGGFVNFTFVKVIVAFKGKDCLGLGART